MINNDEINEATTVEIIEALAQRYLGTSDNIYAQDVDELEHVIKRAFTEMSKYNLLDYYSGKPTNK